MAGQVPEDAKETRLLTTDELYRIYSNRSWIWDDGAGYFQVAGRKFTAFTGSGRTGSYAEGRWFLTSEGRACFRATWFAAAGNAPALTCFEHRTDGSTMPVRAQLSIRGGASDRSCARYSASTAVFRAAASAPGGA